MIQNVYLGLLNLGGHVSVPDPAKVHKLNYDELEDRMKTFKLTPQWEGPLDKYYTVNLSWLQCSMRVS